MLVWLTENLGNIVVSLILICIVTAVIVKMIRDRKQGKSSCGCGCEHCAMHGKCHK
jgi:putative effector of murein hydrolase LrgA (UPF0299 family)